MATKDLTTRGIMENTSYLQVVSEFRDTLQHYKDRCVELERQIPKTALQATQLALKLARQAKGSKC